MSLDLAASLPAALFALLLVVAAGYDIWKRRIPNWTVAALVAVWIVAAWQRIPPMQEWLWCLAALGLSLLITVPLYLFGIIGAGDSKLFSAAALFAGFSNLALFGAATAMTGGLIAIGFLVVRPKAVMRGLTARGRAEAKTSGVPYGVAIALGALITGAVTGFLAPHYHYTHFDPARL